MKSFLEKNKIYFETIIAIIMTVASLVVAVAANRISEAQKEIQEKTVSPNLDISCEYDSEGKVSKVSIINNEGHLNEINIDNDLTNEKFSEAKFVDGDCFCELLRKDPVN